MSIIFSREVLLLTDKENLMPNIVSLLTKNGLTHHSEKRSLSTYNDLIKSVQNNSNLNFIKSDLLDIIKKTGSPFVIIMNLRNETGLDNDRDRLKILKTMLLSYMLIIEAKVNSNMSCNLFILSRENEYTKLKPIMDQPEKILDIVKTKNDKINAIITGFQNDKKRFNNFFNLFISNYDATPLHIESELNTFMSMIKIKERLKGRVQTDITAADTGFTKEKAVSADLFFKKNGALFRNGTETDEIMDDVAEGEIYIVGHFTSYTRLEVLEKLENFIRHGIKDIHSFKPENPLVINLKQRCIPDAAATVTLAQMLIKDLSAFKKTKIRTTLQNNNILKKSQGYSLLSKYIVISE